MTATSIEKMSFAHPRGVGFIAFTQMWESISYFGMRALLVLYLVQSASLSAQDAVILYTLYIAFVQVFATAGGYVVDRFLGYRRAVLLGGSFIMSGHLLLTFSSHTLLFYLGLGSIVCGSALFRVGLHALLGLLYQADDPRREKGFTLLYVGMNVGGLLAAVLCAIVAELLGFHAGFGLAALGMIVGMATFVSQISLLDGLECKRRAKATIYVPAAIATCALLAALLYAYRHVQLIALPLGLVSLVCIVSMLAKKMDKAQTYPIIGAFLLLIAYFTAEELWGTLLMLFTEEHIQRTLFGYEIPSAALSAMNPLTIIVAGPLLAKAAMRSEIKVSLSFLLLSGGFFVLYMASYSPSLSLLALLTGLMLIALGELFLTPTLMAYTSNASPTGGAGMMMGATTLALSLGSLLSGEVARLPTSPTTTFLLIGAVSFAVCMILLVVLRKPLSCRFLN